MPDQSKFDAITRQWQLLKLLPGAGHSGQPKSALALKLALDAEGLKNVSKRTIERDLVQLSLLFPIECDETMTPHGWHWTKGCDLNLPGLDLSDALSLNLLEQFLRPLLPASILRTLEARFHLANSKLKALGNRGAAARWLDKVQVVAPMLNLLPPKIRPGILEPVQEALLNDQQLDLDYRSVDQPVAKAMRVHPLGLVQRGPGAYLVATVFDYVEPRLLAVHRIHRARSIEETAKRPADFSLAAYIASGALEFGDGEAIKLRAQISPALAIHLAETPLSGDMQLDPHGDHVRLSASLRDSWALRWWILAQGEGFVVKHPVALKRDILAEHQAAVAAYIVKA